jgi:hypothetical protein
VAGRSAWSLDNPAQNLPGNYSQRWCTMLLLSAVLFLALGCCAVACVTVEVSMESLITQEGEYSA